MISLKILKTTNDLYYLPPFPFLPRGLRLLRLHHLFLQIILINRRGFHKFVFIHRRRFLWIISIHRRGVQGITSINWRRFLWIILINRRGVICVITTISFKSKPLDISNDTFAVPKLFRLLCYFICRISTGQVTLNKIFFIGVSNVFFLNKSSERYLWKEQYALLHFK